jgi:hypothetical protein
MRGVERPRAFVTSRRCDEASDIEEPFAEALTSESPAHPWRAPVRPTLKSHRSGQRWSLVAGCPELPRAVSGCFVPAATFIHVPVIGCFPLVLLERRPRSVLHAGLKPNMECGD